MNTAGQTVSRTTDLTDADSAAGSVSPAAYPIEIHFRNTTEDELFLRQIGEKLRYANTSAHRSDATAAAYVAQAWMNTRYGLDAPQTTDAEQLSDFLQRSGNYTFCALFRYAEGDLKLTAQILDTAPDLLASSRSVLTKSFRSVLNDVNEPKTDVEICAALYGLSALNEPVLDLLTLVSNHAGSYSTEAKLYLANAYAASGDYASSSAILNALLDAYGTEAGQGTALYLAMGDTESEIRCSSLALLAASRVSRTTAKKLASYLIAMPHRSGESPDLALAAFLTRYLPTEREADKTVRYTLADGEEQTLELAFGRSATICLYKADFEAFRMSNPDGVLVTAVYPGSPDPATDPSANRSLTVRKTIQGTTVFIEISGTTDKRHESFTVDEVIPSGARFISDTTYRSSYVNAYGTHCTANLYNSESQLMKGRISVRTPTDVTKDRNLLYCDPYEFSIVLAYTIREAIAGEFVVEPEILTDTSGQRFYSDGDTSVTFVNGAQVTEIPMNG